MVIPQTPDPALTSIQIPPGDTTPAKVLTGTPTTSHGPRLFWSGERSRPSLLDVHSDHMRPHLSDELQGYTIARGTCASCHISQ
jgi:hypothetical protein